MPKSDTDLVVVALRLMGRSAYSAWATVPPCASSALMVNFSWPVSLWGRVYSSNCVAQPAMSALTVRTSVWREFTTP